jgi:hypothetical protein
MILNSAELTLPMSVMDPEIHQDAVFTRLSTKKQYRVVLATEPISWSMLSEPIMAD